MASKGHNFNQSVVVGLSPEEVSQSVIAASSGVPGYSVTTAGAGSIVMTRRYTPTWAIVLAIVGFFLFLIGILFLFVKSNETVTITLSPSGNKGTKVFASGTASKEMQQRLTAVLSGMTSSGINSSGAEAMQTADDGSNTDRFEQIAKVAELRDSGTLTEEEFQAEKSRILGS